jgi:hypothetical protein
MQRVHGRNDVGSDCENYCVMVGHTSAEELEHGCLTQNILIPLRDSDVLATTIDIDLLSFL